MTFPDRRISAEVACSLCARRFMDIVPATPEWKPDPKSLLVRFPLCLRCDALIETQYDKAPGRC